jgi:signal peptidase II
VHVVQTEGRTSIGETGSRKPLVLFALAIVALDQITKALAVAFLEERVSVPVIGTFFQLRLVRNPGAAFSLGESATYIFTLIAVIAVVVILRYAPRIEHRAWRIALALVLAGAMGNLIDRLFRSPGFPGGHVVDFFQLPRWPIFNIADMAISFAVVLGLILTVRGIEPQERQRP